MTDWTLEEDEAFNEVEKQSNLGKQILQAQGQPYHWEADAIKAAVLIEREACAKYVESLMIGDKPLTTVMGALGDAIRARGQA